MWTNCIGGPITRMPGLMRWSIRVSKLISSRMPEINVETKERFQFTEREQTIVQCLSRGWTNKQIAVAVNLALPTVKEHIRHIMDKTKTNTRTGILVQVYRM